MKDNCIVRYNKYHNFFEIRGLSRSKAVKKFKHDKNYAVISKESLEEIAKELGNNPKSKVYKFVKELVSEFKKYKNG